MSAQNYIEKNFGDLKWRKEKIRNQCNDNLDKLEFHNSQKFVKRFFNPKNTQKGLLAYHTVGSGKTATAVYAASGFEQDYQIIWVTMNKLRNVVWKNIFGAMSAHPAMRDYEGRMPRTMGAKKRIFNKLTKKNWKKPITYKEFENALLKKNEFGKNLYERNKKDPLKKTLVIIDEAHNLYNDNLSTQQRPNIDIISRFIHKSYKISGRSSVKVLLLSATPLTNDMIGFSKMFNLLIPKETKRLKTELLDILKYYNNDFSDFNAEANKRFKKLGKYVSYLNVSGNVNIFAQPKYLIENIKLTGSGLDKNSFTEKADKIKSYKKIEMKNCHLPSLNAAIKQIEKQDMPVDIKIEILKNNFSMFHSKDLKALLMEKENKEACKKGPKENKKTCTDNVKESVKSAKASNKVQSNLCKDNVKIEVDKKKAELKSAKKNFAKSSKIAISKCFKEGNSNKTELACMKKGSLWGGPVQASFKFENINFDMPAFKEAIKQRSSKLQKLMENIKKFDEEDMRKDSKYYKHIIYVNDGTYNGVKLVMSALMANDFNYQIDVIRYITRRGRTATKLQMPERIINGDKNFSTLVSTSIHKATMKKRLLKQVQDAFNNRENNVYGRKIRFILIDKNFLEGIDIYDVKYLHILDPYLFKTEMTQLIGRGIRTCGQKGLPFKHNEGWKLNIVKYNSILDDENFDNKIIKKRLDVMEIEEEELKAKNVLERKLREFALDKKLTEKL